MAVKKKTTVRKRNLVIVESPSKAKTISKFLGSNYKVIASVGHIRDLPKSKLGIDIENDFEPQYINIRGKGDLIKELKKEGKKAGKIFLATDHDREGEAISWHLAHILDIEDKSECRIVFNEITKEAVKTAIKNPRTIDRGLVDAQQARRVLDRLVGYSISPLLWRKIRKGLSAGRVQSAALNLICKREKEINEFVPEEYWNISANYKKENIFEGKLISYKGKKIFLKDEKEAKSVVDELNKNEHKVVKVQEKQRSRKPAPPYTTSSLQQDGANKINFSSKKTMQIAQQLYEGIDIKGKGTVGLVTYIRTDSTRVSQEARLSAKSFINKEFGEKYYGGTIFAKGNRDIQDAHEAIRPSYIELTPDSIKESLTRDQYKLYNLIWSRFIASQMASAVYSGVAVDIENGNYTLRSTGSTLVFDGYLKVYNIDRDEDKLIPKLVVGEVLNCEEILSTQHFTQPPARFNEASLVKTLEEKSIGRPSTYAPIIGTLTGRRYIKKEGKTLVPTDLGFTVDSLVAEYFKEIVDTNFTAEMEGKLDKVGLEIDDWKEILRDFYKIFKEELDYADENIEKIEAEEELTDEICDLCGSFMVKKQSRFGEFLACSSYPECKNTKAIVKEIGVRCISCGGEILERTSRRGKIFFGCSNYPTCEASYWTKPTGEKCPLCKSMLVEKDTKRFQGVVCSNNECKYKEARNKEE